MGPLYDTKISHQLWNSPGIFMNTPKLVGWTQLSLRGNGHYQGMFQVQIKSVSTSAPSTGCLLWLSCGWTSSELLYNYTLASHSVALPFTLKSIWRQKKNYENSNISPCRNIIFQKSFKRNENPSRLYNSITNLKFQHKPEYHLSKILIWK
jgi:hypothetical protein